MGKLTDISLDYSIGGIIRQMRKLSIGSVGHHRAYCPVDPGQDQTCPGERPVLPQKQTIVPEGAAGHIGGSTSP